MTFHESDTIAALIRAHSDPANPCPHCGIVLKLPKPHDAIDGKAVVQQAVKRASRASTRLAILCVIPAAAVSAAAYALGAPGLVIQAAGYVAAWLAHRMWKRRSVRKERDILRREEETA